MLKRLDAADRLRPKVGRLDPRGWMEQLLPRMRQARHYRRQGLCPDCGGAVARHGDLACPVCIAGAIAMH